MSNKEIVSYSAISPQVKSLTIYKSGLHLKPPRGRVTMPRHEPAKRGKITYFSMHAAARMRDFFLRYDVPDCDKFAVTLTLPGKGWTGSLDDFKRILNATFAAWRYQCPHAGMVWRVELQKRKAPHVHATVFGRVGDETALCSAWACYIIKHFNGFDVQDFLKHGVRAERCPCDSVGWYRYCMDHATKHKCAQLGYQGKQWGIINRSAFSPNPALAALDLDEEPPAVVWWFIRYFQRLNRYPVTIKGADGKRIIVKYRRNRRLFGVSFLRGGGAMVLKLLEYARYTAANAPRVRADAEEGGATWL